MTLEYVKVVAVLRELVDHIEACDEEALLYCDNDPHPPSVFSVLGEQAKDALALVDKEMEEAK